MGLANTIVAILLAVLITLASLYIIGVSFPEETTTTTTTTFPNETTTTTTTTTTVPIEETISWLEKRVHDLVNAEREAHGLQNLTHNSEVAAVARMHSADMATNDYFDHTNLQGLSVSDRLKDAGIYYWNLTGENLLKISRVKYFYVDRFGNISRIEYNDWETFARESVDAWMNSTGHKSNILYPNYNEAGIGIVYAGNETYYYYMTQNFITHTGCGYYEGECCPASAPYLPWCYVPHECRNGVCR